MRLGARGLRRLAWAAAFVWCSTQAAAELHLHDAALPAELCTACTLAHADLVSGAVSAGVPDPTWLPATAAGSTRVPANVRPFEAERSRAPPPHF